MKGGQLFLFLWIGWWIVVRFLQTFSFQYQEAAWLFNSDTNNDPNSAASISTLSTVCATAEPVSSSSIGSTPSKHRGSRCRIPNTEAEEEEATMSAPELDETGAPVAGPKLPPRLRLGRSNSPPPNAEWISPSKRDTDDVYVGLVNQAMTCYLNSLLQTLFMTPEFRNALYK